MPNRDSYRRIPEVDPSPKRAKLQGTSPGRGHSVQGDDAEAPVAPAAVETSSLKDNLQGANVRQVLGVLKTGLAPLVAALASADWAHAIVSASTVNTADLTKLPLCQTLGQPPKACSL